MGNKESTLNCTVDLFLSISSTCSSRIVLLLDERREKRNEQLKVMFKCFLFYVFVACTRFPARWFWSCD